MDDIIKAIYLKALLFGISLLDVKLPYTICYTFKGGSYFVRDKEDPINVFLRTYQCQI